MSVDKPVKPARGKAVKPAILMPEAEVRQPDAPLPVAAIMADVAAEPIAVPVAPAPVATTPVNTRPAETAAPQKGPIMTDMNRINETVTDTSKTIADKAQVAFADMNDRAKTAVEKTQKMVEDMTDFQKGNVEALVESAKIAAKGAEEIMRYSAEYGRKTVEKAAADARTLASVKSPTEFFQLQNDAAKAAFDEMVAQSSKFTENYLKLLGNIAQPLSNRVAVAAERVKLAA